MVGSFVPTMIARVAFTWQVHLLERTMTIECTGLHPTDPCHAAILSPVSCLRGQQQVISDCRLQPWAEDSCTTIVKPQQCFWVYSQGLAVMHSPEQGQVSLLVLVFACCHVANHTCSWQITMSAVANQSCSGQQRH